MPGLVLRPLLLRPLRLVAAYIGAAILLAIPDLLLQRFVDPDLPRAALVMLLLVLAAAGLFLRASWRCRPGARMTPRRRSFALWIAVQRGRNGVPTRTAVVFDRYRRPGRAQPSGAGPGRISRR